MTKKDEKMEFSSEFINSFKHCKQLLTNDPILIYSDLGKASILSTDASDLAIGSKYENVPHDRPIAYDSRTLNDTKTCCLTIEKALLAITWACKHFRAYLFGRKFKTTTDR